MDFSRFNDEINLTTSILFDGLLPLFLNSFLVVQMFYVNNRKDKGRMSALCKDLRMTEQKRARVVCNGAKEWVSAGVFRSINDQTKVLRRCTSGGESQY